MRGTPVVRLIGAPTDVHSSYLRGAALAPAAIRAALASDHGNATAESGIELGVDVIVDDRGDLPLADTLAATAADDALLFAAVGNAAASGAMPLVLGGDHSVSIPVVAALAARHGPLNILHFDAHPDIYDDFDGDPRSHASPFARILESGHATRLVQVGIRTMNRHCREQAARFGVEVVDMRDFRDDGVPVLSGPLYISIDLDGFDPSVAHLEPGGLTVRSARGSQSPNRPADRGRHRRTPPTPRPDRRHRHPRRQTGAGVCSALCSQWGCRMLNPGKFSVRIEDIFHMTEARQKWFSEPQRSIEYPAVLGFARRTRRSRRTGDEHGRAYGLRDRLRDTRSQGAWIRNA